MTRRRALAAAIGLGYLAIAATPPAAASCAPPAPIDQAIAEADVVVVGTVAATRSADRIATIRVEDVWKGDVGGELVVYGGPEDGMATSIDRTWTKGERYLVIALEPAAHGYEPTFGGRYESNGCMATRPFSDDPAANRPTDAPGAPSSTLAPSAPSASSASAASSVTLPSIAVASGALVLAGLGTAWMWRRRRATTPPATPPVAAPVP